MKDYYIVRSTVFAKSGSSKILYTLASLYISLFGLEYASIYAISTSIWTLVEYLLQKYKVRKISPMYIGKKQVPRTLALFLQGSQEAGFVTVYSLYFADNYKEQADLLLYTLCLIFLNVIVSKRWTNQGQYYSRRKITDKKSVSILSLVTAIDIYYLTNVEFLRPFEMLCIMNLFGIIWTYAQVNIKARNVVNEKGFPVSFTEKILVLFYDILIEIAMAYMPFYILNAYWMRYI